MSSSLPDGVTVQPVVLGDAPAINELIKAADEAVQGWSESSEGELLGWWRMLDLADNSWVLRDRDAIAGYGVGFAHADMFELDGYVHPDRRGLGFGAWLTRRAEERAVELGKRRLLAYSMMIDLESEPGPPPWPAGLHVDTFRPEDAKEFHAALGEAFEDEWNFVLMPFDEWREMRLVNDPEFDPTLWFIVRADDELAAVMRNEPDRSGAGFVGARGVAAASPRRCCSTRSRSSTGEASAASPSASTPRT
jgi:GNAT superfamily N-acetyltransferase